jgi:hypothetical protein
MTTSRTRRKALKTYTARPDAFLPRAVLDALGITGHVRQGTVWVRTTSISVAASLLRERGIGSSPSDIRVAMGSHPDAVIDAGLLTEPGSIIATTLQSLNGDALVSVAVEGVAVLGHWRNGENIGDWSVELVDAPATEQV